ncbi:hypothetical protein ALI22I_20400 [Saccharothrix sp. ALI-22-I]|uniref:hypothetical protein n=1 Tax=Saccharothrix sp. ALI-22-I TaxID=1933778 RepID=UPI00097BF7F6|nr:hypothetical protein [Saccharothrix sp. ALI-22-I]ONI88102.1 hypothetical protein ALI22I_20400 [Saccharothrix sp. ALI-22-I]
MTVISVFVPYFDSVVLGSAHRRPWIAESAAQARLSVPDVPDYSPVFLTLDACREWIAWLITRSPWFAGPDRPVEIREVVARTHRYGDQPWTWVTPANGVPWEYQLNVPRHQAV